MKTNLCPKSSAQGNTLLVALMLCMILTISIAGYLKNATTQNFHSARSQAWNMSMTVTEAAVEEAMEHLNSNTENLGQQGWTQSGVNKYSIKRNFTPTATYSVTIDMTSPSKPRITAKSADAAPVLGAGTSFAAAGLDATTPSAATVGRAVQVTAWRSGMFLKAMVAKHQIDMNGNGVVTDSFDSSDPNHSNNGFYPAGDTSKLLDNGDVASNDSVKNIVNIGNANIYGHVAVGPGGSVSIGPNGGVGTHSWQSGNGGIQDGYFSDDMNFTFGSYPVPSGGSSVTKGPFTITNMDVTISSNTVTSSIYPSPKPAGGVQTNLTYLTVTTKPNPLPAGTITNTLTTYTTNSDYPVSGTYIGTVSSYQVSKGNGNGNKTDTFWTYNAITGYSYTYPGYTYTYASYSSSTNISVNKYDYVLDGSLDPDKPSQFYMSSFNGGTVLIRKNVQLAIGGNFSMSGKDSLTLASDGKLTMYVGGTSCDLGGNGVINPSGYARNFICYCADTVTSMSFSGNGMFCGILVAPNANLKLNGGGKDNNDFVGSVIANTITLNGHFSFHYDESLKNLKNSGRYIIREWHEIPLELAGD
jgi:Tfp pilus assembly protein PilX